MMCSRVLLLLPVFLAGLFGAAVPAHAADAGEDLARTWCVSCHAYPPPDLLDRETWISSVLPQMGARMGFQTFRGTPHPPDPVAPDGIYADEPFFEQADWEKIIGFYEQMAPDALPPSDTLPSQSTDLFSIEEVGVGTAFPSTTAVLIDESADRLVVADAFDLSLTYYAGDDLAKQGGINTGGVVSRIKVLPEGGYAVLIIGSTIGQTESHLGLLIRVDAENPGVPDHVTRLVRHLHRPVDMLTGDFNADGLTDYVVAGFGTHEGELRLALARPDGGFDEDTLLFDPGATSLARRGDDLYVLIAQGNERIIRVADFADEVPDTKVLVEMPPSYGSSNMVVADMDGDGIDDLVVTAGDNADISPVYKPYHGVYLYRGLPDGEFIEPDFVPLDGAYGSAVADFDLDGDTDIAVIAYFPRLDLGLDEASFVLLENTEAGFVPKSVQNLGALGRFIAITAGDLDGDEDPDIALANLAFGPYGPMVVPEDVQQGWLAGPRVVVLRNQSR